MVVSHASWGSSRQRWHTSVRWVANSSTVRSLNSKTFWMNVVSCGAMTPLEPPFSTSSRISSSLTSSSSASGSTPHSRSTRLVEAVSAHTMGAKSFEIKETRLAMPSASDSARFMASRLGTNSPKMRVT